MLEFLRDLLRSPEFATFLNYVLLTSATAAIGYVGYLARRFVNNKLSADELRALQEAARIAVLYVEQTTTGKELLEASLEKRAEAIRVAQSHLQTIGIKVSVERLVTAIEAAVYAEITRQPAPAPPIDELPVA